MFYGFGRGLMRRYGPGGGFGRGGGRKPGFGFAQGFIDRSFYGWGRGGLPRCNTPGLRRAMLTGIPYRMPRRPGRFY